MPQYLDPKTVLIYRPHPVCKLDQVYSAGVIEASDDFQEVLVSKSH
jgi:hypothetical protein